MVTPEQEARDLLERMGIEDAQSFTAGDVVELANWIADKHLILAKAARYEYIKQVAMNSGGLEALVAIERLDFVQDPNKFDADIDKLMKKRMYL